MRLHRISLLQLLICSAAAIPSLAQEDLGVRTPRLDPGNSGTLRKIYTAASPDECEPGKKLSGFDAPYQFWKENPELAAEIAEQKGSFSRIFHRVDSALGMQFIYDGLLFPELGKVILVPTSDTSGDTASEVLDEDRFFPCRYLVLDNGNSLERGIYKEHISGVTKTDKNRRLLPVRPGSILQIHERKPGVATHTVGGKDRKYISISVDTLYADGTKSSVGAERKFQCYEVDTARGSEDKLRKSPAIFYITGQSDQEVAVPIEWCERATKEQSTPPASLAGITDSIRVYNRLVSPWKTAQIDAISGKCDASTKTLNINIHLSQRPQIELPRPLAVAASYSYFTDHRCNQATKIRWTFLADEQKIKDFSLDNGEHFNDPRNLTQAILNKINWTDLAALPANESSKSHTVEILDHFNDLMYGKYPEVKVTRSTDSNQMTLAFTLEKSFNEISPEPLRSLCAFYYAATEDCDTMKSIVCHAEALNTQFHAEIPTASTCDATALLPTLEHSRIFARD